MTRRFDFNNVPELIDMHCQQCKSEKNYVEEAKIISATEIHVFVQCGDCQFADDVIIAGASRGILEMQGLLVSETPEDRAMYSDMLRKKLDVEDA